MSVMSYIYTIFRLSGTSAVKLTHTLRHSHTHTHADADTLMRVNAFPLFPSAALATLKPQAAGYNFTEQVRSAYVVAQDGTARCSPSLRLVPLSSSSLRSWKLRWEQACQCVYSCSLCDSALVTPHWKVLWS